MTTLHSKTINNDLTSQFEILKSLIKFIKGRTHVEQQAYTYIRTRINHTSKIEVKHHLRNTSLGEFIVHLNMSTLLGTRPNLECSTDLLGPVFHILKTIPSSDGNFIKTFSIIPH